MEKLETEAGQLSEAFGRIISGKGSNTVALCVAFTPSAESETRGGLCCGINGSINDVANLLINVALNHSEIAMAVSMAAAAIASDPEYRKTAKAAKETAE